MKSVYYPLPHVILYSNFRMLLPFERENIATTGNVLPNVVIRSHIMSYKDITH